MADWRYPFNPGLNQSAQLPTNFGPPNQSAQIQGALGSFLDPILAKILQQQATERAVGINTKLAELGESYNKPAATTTAAAAAVPPVSPAPGVAAANAGSPAGDDNTGTMGGGKSSASNPEVRDKFISEVRSTGLTNPYGLAAVAATGQRESGWSTGNVNRTWADGQYPSGGTLSWNGPRLRAMQEYTAGAEDPVAAQAAFFMKENPRLIAALNAAQSPEEANKLMADAWRFKGYNTNSPEFKARENLTRAYAGKFERAPPPQGAPQTAFSPTVAPAPTPQAAAAVTAPQGQQAAPYAPAYMDAATGGGINPNDPRVNAALQARPVPGRPAPQGAPGPQAQAPQQAMPAERTQQSQAEAQQQEVIANVGQGSQQLQQRLDAERQAGQQTRVASISPQLPGLGLGGVMPGGGGGTPSPPPPPQQQRPPAAPPSDPSFFSPEPMMPPQTAARPATSAPPPGAPAATAGPPPPMQPEPAVAPFRVAQAQPQGLPAAINAQQQTRRPISNEEAKQLLRMAGTPEEAYAIGAFIAKSREQAAPVHNRFKIENGYRIDTLDGTVTPLGEVPGGMFKGNSVEAQALNHLIANGILTPRQAAEVAGGSKIAGSDGSIYFFRPQDLAGGGAGGGIQRQAPPAAGGGGGAAPAPAAPAPEGPRQLVPPKAEKPDNISPEAASRISLGNTFLEKVPDIRKKIDGGVIDSPKARAQLLGGYGEPGTIKRDMASGRDALLRGLTGAGMSVQEAKEYVERYAPSIRDTRDTLREKLDNLERELKAVREGVLSGRKITDPALRGREPPGSGGGFTSPGGTIFREVR